VRDDGAYIWYGSVLSKYTGLYEKKTSRVVSDDQNTFPEGEIEAAPCNSLMYVCVRCLYIGPNETCARKSRHW
jgi:hypothetical protein